MLRDLLPLRLATAEADFFYWVTSMTETIDEQDKENPYKPFPEKDYVRYLAEAMLKESILLGPKSRSMLASWTFAALACWLCQTQRATTVIVQSRDEQRGIKLVEYARVLYERSHPEWQNRHKLMKTLSSQPANEIRWANDSWIKAITGTANSIRSEHPTIVIFDEAGFMDEFEDCFNTAQGAKPLHVWAISSANAGPFFDLFDRAKPCDWPKYDGTPELPSIVKGKGLDAFKKAPVKRPVPGLTFGRTDKGWAVVHLHYSADPDRGPAWVTEQKAKYSTDSMWKKEQEIDPYALDGARVYPEYDDDVHVITHDKIPLEMCLYMAIDPHPRTPHAMLWVGVDQWDDVYVYRELWPSKVYAENGALKDTDEENRFTIREYVETAAKLEGNSIEWHKAEKADEYGKYLKSARGENILDRYMDQAGKGFGTDSDSHKSESYWDRYRNFGFQCIEPLKQHAAGEDAIRDLLKPRFHDTKGLWPRLHISDRCPELQWELKRHKYVVTRRWDPMKELPQEGAKVRTHMIDLLRYLATAPLGFYYRQRSRICLNISVQ